MSACANLVPCSGLLLGRRGRLRILLGLKEAHIVPSFTRSSQRPRSLTHNIIQSLSRFFMCKGTKRKDETWSFCLDHWQLRRGTHGDCGHLSAISGVSLTYYFELTGLRGLPVRVRFSTFIYSTIAVSQFPRRRINLMKLPIEDFQCIPRLRMYAKRFQCHL